jgi:hypothetical protein
MDNKTANIIETRLRELRMDALKAFKMQVMRIYSSANHPAFIPDSMVSEAVRASEENVAQLLRHAVSGASGVSEAPEAFLLVHDAVAAHLLDLEKMVEQGRGIPLPPATLKMINERSGAVRQRSEQNLENYRASFSGSKNKGGRPSKWDWEGALIYVAAQANLPDGLIDEEGGTQADIEEMISEWFIQRTGDSPAESEIRKRASAVMKAISKPQKAGN